MVDGVRLLLVEDDAATREVLALLLGSEGWTVEAAESGEAALALLEKGGVMAEMVLSDLHLPGVCGAALAGRLREVLGQDAVLVAMTASVRAGSGTGYDAVLQKPFAAEAVEAAWRQGVERVAGGEGSACGGTGNESQRVEDVGSSRTGELGTDDAGERAAVLDLAVVETLRRRMGEAGAREFYAFALADADERMDRMAAALDEAAFVREAHALKGSCGMMGARRLWQLASAAEEDGLRGGGAQEVVAMRLETGEIRRLLQTFLSI